MDVAEVTEKLFNFCKEKYPDLNWNLGSRNNIIQCTGFPNELTIDVFVGQEEIKGWCTLNSLDWVGGFIVLLNCDKKSELCFYTETVDEWSAEHWLLCKQTQKIMLGIYTFILDEIQE